MITPLPLLLALSVPDPEELNKRARMGGDLQPQNTPVSIRDRDLSVGNCDYHFESGVVLPIKAGRRENQRNAGVVFQGEGSVTVHFDTRADAWAFANHMVLKGNYSADEMRAVALEGADFTTPISRGVVVSTHADVNDLLIPPRKGDREEIKNYDAILVVEDKRHTGAFLKAGATLPNRLSNWIAGGLDPRPRIAQEILTSEFGGLAWDERMVVADFLTDSHYNVARGPDSVAVGPNDRWLSCLVDPTGALEQGEHSTVFAHGRDPDQNYHRVRFTGAGYPVDKREDPDVPGLRARDFEAIEARVKVDARPIRLRKYIRAQVRSRLTFEAQRDGAQILVLNMPRYEGRENTFQIHLIADRRGNALSWTALNSDIFGGQMTGDPASLASVDTDPDKGSTTSSSSQSTSSSGVDSTAANSTASDATDNSEDGSGLSLSSDPGSTFTDDTVNMSVDRAGQDYPILVLLPEPLEAGEQVDIVMDWETQWNFIQMGSQGAGGEVQSLGPTTGFRNLLPELWPQAAGTRWDHETTVTTPSLYNYNVAISGETIRENWDQEVELMTLTVRGQDDLRPGVAMGKWNTHEEPPAFGYPGVRIHLNPAEAYSLEEIAPELRRVLGFYARLMPELPVDEFEIYQGRDLTFTRDRNEPGDGMLEINQLIGRGGGTGANTLYRELDPFTGQTMLSRELARRYWDGLVQPGGARDAWLAWVMPEVYSAFYVRGVQGTQPYFEWMETLRGYLEDPQEQVDRLGVPQNMRPALDLTDTGTEGTRGWYGGLAQRFYGLYVMGNMLRYRVGEDVYYKALDRVLTARKHNFITTEMLQEALEYHSGQDLDDFFDFWVYQGIIPGVTVEVLHQDDGTLRGCIQSDVPFGSFDLPVTVDDQEGFRRVGALVDVDNGHGQFEVPGRTADFNVMADPEGLILLTSREVREVKDLSHCWITPPPPQPETTPDTSEDPSTGEDTGSPTAPTE